MEHSKAPWTKDQISCLNQWQSCGFFHPFTCGNPNCRAELVATEKGWKCPVEGCGYTQDWAHGFMAKYEPKKMNWAS